MEKKDNLFQLLATGDHYKYIIIEYEAVLFKHIAVVTAQAKGGYKINVQFSVKRDVTENNEARNLAATEMCIILGCIDRINAT